MEFEEAHGMFINKHLTERSGERRGGWLEGIIMRRSCSYRMYGGHCLRALMICIQNTKCTTGTVNLSFWTSLFFRRAAAVSGLSATGFKVM